MAADKHRIALDVRLTDDGLVPRHGPYKWPLPVLERVRGLVETANQEGVRTGQAELIAAILCALEPDTADLAAQVRDYRVMPVRRTLPTGSVTQLFTAAGAGRPRGS